MPEKYISIGFTKKAHGAGGELKATVKPQFLEDLLIAGLAFINLQGKPVPFFLEAAREAGDLILKFESVDSPAEAKKLTSKELFLREQDITAPGDEPEDELVFSKYTGFEMFDAERGRVGEILEVLEYPQQELARVAFKSGEILIPLHRDLVVSIDKKAKKMTLRLPEGLLDL